MIVEYLEESIRWDVIYQNCKYTIMEMLNNRRHQKRFSAHKPDLGPGRTMQEVGRCKSVRELSNIFGISDEMYDKLVERRSSESPLSWHARLCAGSALSSLANGGIASETKASSGGGNADEPVLKRPRTVQSSSSDDHAQ